MALETGTWTIDGNGSRGDLIIQGIANDGSLTGTAYGQEIEGWWDEQAQRISFVRLLNPSDHKQIQAFVGYHWRENVGSPSGTTFYLAGSFDTFAGAGGKASQPAYGWFAKMQGPPG
jgi:hypothetical protein